MTGRRIAGHIAKKRGATVEGLALRAAENYRARGLAYAMHVGPPVKQLGPLKRGRFEGVYVGHGPPDLLLEIQTPEGLRHGWMEIKGRSAPRVPLEAVEAHQAAALERTSAGGAPALVLVCLRPPACLPGSDKPDSSGWWVVPFSRWMPGELGTQGRASFNAARLDVVGARCEDLLVPGKPAGVDAVPDWLGAIKAIDARGDCPWVRLWKGETDD